MKTYLLAATLGIVLLGPVYGQKQHHLMVDKITCNAKTEHGVGPFPNRDDIYFLILVKDSKGNFYERREPGGNHPFEKGTARKTDALLNIEGMIGAGDGHGTDVLVICVEEDKVRFNDYMDKARETFKGREVSGETSRKLVNGTASADMRKSEANFWEEVIKVLVEVAKTLGEAEAKDTDDIPGVMLAKIVNDKGTLKAKWIAGDRATLKSETATSGTFSLTGDGSNYDVTLVIEAR